MNSTGTEGISPLESSLGGLEGPGKSQSDVDPAIGGMDVSNASRRPKVSSSTLLVVGVVIVASGVLWGMRFVGMGAGVALATTANTKELETFALKPAIDHRKVLADLQASRTQLQVNEAEVKKNPFVLTGSDAPGPDLAVMSAQRAAELARIEEERKRKERAEFLAKVEGMKGGIKLNAVILGSVPAARINARVFRLGDTVQGMFTLAKVNDRSIELEFEGRTFRIEMTGGEGLEGNGANSPESPSLDPTEPAPAPYTPGPSNSGPPIPAGPRNGPPSPAGPNR